MTPGCRPSRPAECKTEPIGIHELKAKRRPQGLPTQPPLQTRIGGLPHGRSRLCGHHPIRLRSRRSGGHCGGQRIQQVQGRWEGYLVIECRFSEVHPAFPGFIDRPTAILPPGDTLGPS